MIKEKWIVIIGPVIVLLLNLSSGWLFEESPSGKIIAWKITVLAGLIFLQWQLAYLIVKWFREQFPLLASVRQRSIYTFGAVMLCSFGWQIMADFIIDSLIGGKQPAIEWPRVINILVQSVLFSFTTIGLFESVYYYRNLRKAESEKEELIKANMQSRFESLKSQVNPHFLFNSLNTLSSLIAKDPARAELFVEEMSAVYRYLLRSNENALVTLKEELDFINSYMHLLSTRFGSNLKLMINIDEQYMPYLLPPLTLQMLTENVVKHNIISKDMPVQLDIYTTPGNRLHVENTLQRKTNEVISNRMGLSNILSKYKLLKQPAVEIKETPTKFIVILPLINDKEYESIYN